MATKPPTDRYLSVKSMVFDSVAFRTLPSGALKLWVDLRVQFRGANNGNISAALSTLKHRGWSSSETLNRALWELLRRGLLRRTREGKPGPLRICALFAFTDLPMNANDKLGIVKGGATMEFVHWVPGKSFAPDSRAERIPHNTSEKKSPLRKSELQRSDNQIVAGTKSGELKQDTAPNIEAVTSGSNGRKAAPVLASEPIAH